MLRPGISYEKWLKDFNLGSRFLECQVCSGSASLFPSSKGKTKIRQFCTKERLSRMWRRCVIDMTKEHCVRFIRENKLLTVEEASKIIAINPHYIRDRVARRLIPFVELGHRIFLAEKDLESIKIYFALIKRRVPRNLKTNGGTSNAKPGEAPNSQEAQAA